MERRFSRRGFGDRDFGGRFEKPVKIGEEYDVEIKEVGSRGDGIARVKNFVIFVANTKKGEKCKIKINQVSRRFAIAEKVGKAEKIEEAAEEPEEEKVEEKVEKVKEEEVEKKPKGKEKVEEVSEKVEEPKEITEEKPKEEVEGKEVEDK